MGIQEYDSSGITFTFTSDTVSVSNFNGATGTNTIIIIVYGVMHPNPSSDYSGDFAITTYADTDLLIDKKDDIYGFEFLSTFSPGEISFVGIYNNPSNADALAEYQISFITSQQLPVDSIIEINFPFA